MSNDTKQQEQDKAQQYLSFILDDDEYAVDILSVKEIRGWEQVTPIPNTPDYIRGFINLRGSIVPVVDLRMRFNLEVREYNKSTVVIILNLANEETSKEFVGIIVDAVSEVYSVNKSDISPAPRLGGHVDARYIQGIAEVNSKNIILTDVLSLLNAEELLEITQNT